MTDHAGGLGSTIKETAVADVQTAAKTRQGFDTALDTGAVVPASEPVLGAFSDELAEALPVTAHNADQELATGVGVHWFEQIHYTPEQIELGNLLTTVTQEIEIYNSYRRETQTFTSATNNAGSGISFIGLPSLPVELGTQSGAVFDVEITTQGPPTIDGTLDFVTDPHSFSIPITGSRIVMFAYEPETPIVETLEFKTDVVRAADGTEQRVAWRKNPRQVFEMMLRIPEGADRRKMMNLLKGWHQRVFGVPIWWESRALETSVATGATTIPIDTAHADYRVGGLVIIWSDPDTFDAVEIDTVNADSLEISSPVTHDYDADTGVLVMPLRVAYTDPGIDIQTYLNALQDVKMRFRVIDNDVGDSFGDTSPYSTHNSKVMLDGPNVSGETVNDSLHREIQALDNEIGDPQQFSTWLSSTVITKKAFPGNTRQEVWEARKLAHALRGSQVSFYLPTFYEDMVVTENLTSAGNTMDIEHIGYADYVDGVEPFKSIWIELDDGTILTRQVTAAEAVDESTERLTVDVAWPSDITAAEISRVSLLRLVRIADDKVRITHHYPGSADISMNVRGAS